MVEKSQAETEKIEKSIIKKLRHWILSVALLCLLGGIAIGFLFFGNRTNAVIPENYKATPEALSASFAEIAKRVEPSVVNIDAKAKSNSIGIKGNSEEETQLDNMLKRRVVYAVGSGFIVDKTGYILTNNHVIEDTTKITVRLQNGEEYIAEVVGTDLETDVAVLKINAGKDLPSIKLGDSNSAQVGDWVLAIGSPFGLDQTVTAGIISTIGRETPNATSFQKFTQTDAAINRGNSGGPLVSMNGDVVGINSQIASTTGDYNGIGFALPSNEASYVYQQIVQNGKVKRGYLGVSLDSVKPPFAKVYEMPDLKGAFITEIRDKEGPAGKAGLQVNDIVVEINGQPVSNSQDLISKVALTSPDKEANVVFLREINNKLERMTAIVKLAERPSRSGTQDLDKPKVLGQKNTPKPEKPFGLTLVEMTPALAVTVDLKDLKNAKGLLIKEIDSFSAIAEVKDAVGREALRTNDLIQRVNRTTVTDLKAFTEIVSKLKTGDSVVLHVVGYNRITQTVQPRIVQFTLQ